MKWAGRVGKGTRAHERTRRVGVAKGFGPRHAENAKEGDMPNTDTVPAMLTPREAVLTATRRNWLGVGRLRS